MMKNMKWKKYAGAAMAAAMIPALAAPIATEAAPVTKNIGLQEGHNIVITLDGKHALTKAESAEWFDKKQIKVVNTETDQTYTANNNGVFWVPATEGKATIYDVAKLACVSLATASRVINGSDKVALETKERVLMAIKQLNYTQLKNINTLNYINPKKKKKRENSL